MDRKRRLGYLSFLRVICRMDGKTTKTSVHGAINMLGLAKRIKAKILQATTSEVYGDPHVHPQTEGYWGNVNPIGYRSCYDEGKRCAETLFFDYYRQHGIKIKVGRIFNTYGPRMHPNDGRVVSNFIVQALRGESITVFGDGSQSNLQNPTNIYETYGTYLVKLTVIDNDGGSDFEIKQISIEDESIDPVYLDNEIIIYPTDDAYIKMINPNINYGSSEELIVKYNNKMDTLIKFDLPPNLKYYDITCATLYLYYYNPYKI